MGQAFRRAAGRSRSSGLDASSSSPFQPVSQKPPPPPPPTPTTPPPGARIEVIQKTNGEGNTGHKRQSELEARDPQFDEMLNQMVGRITSKAGGKSEMGEAFVSDKYNRPMPKLRNTKPDSGRYEDRAAPPGTLNVAQLRQIMLLYQGRADDHDGPININNIAERFRLEASQVEKILQFVSLPPEEAVKKQTQGP